MLRAVGAVDDIIEYQLIDKRDEKVLGYVKVRFCGEKRIFIDEINLMSREGYAIERIMDKIEKTFEGFQVLDKSIGTNHVF